MSPFKIQPNWVSRSASRKILQVAAAATFLFLIAAQQTSAGEGFSIDLSPASATVQAGSSVAYTITIQCTGCTVSLSASITPLTNNSPQWGVNPFTLSNIQGSAQATLTLTTTTSTTPGTYTVTAFASSGGNGCGGYGKCNSQSKSVSSTLIVN